MISIENDDPAVRLEPGRFDAKAVRDTVSRKSPDEGVARQFRFIDKELGTYRGDADGELDRVSVRREQHFGAL